jgi:hypothetical protein
MEDEDENQWYTPITRRTTEVTRSTSSPLNLRATKKATQRAGVKIMESERKNSVEATQGGDKLAFLREKVGVTGGLKIQFLRPGPGTRIEVISENKAQAEKARKNTHWATGQFHSVRVQGEKWYPVNCDMFARQVVLDRTATDDKTRRQRVCQDFSKDNQVEGIDFMVTKGHWLSKADYKKKVGSLIIWLESNFAEDHLLKSGTAIFGATGAYYSKL